MTEYEIFDEIVKCYEARTQLGSLLDDFTEIAQESPLTNPQEQTLITQYETRLVELNELYKVLVNAYVKRYQDMQNI